MFLEKSIDTETNYDPEEDYLHLYKLQTVNGHIVVDLNQPYNLDTIGSDDDQ
jgi:hypothetical protein